MTTRAVRDRLGEALDGATGHAVDNAALELAKTLRAQCAGAASPERAKLLQRVTSARSGEAYRAALQRARLAIRDYCAGQGGFLAEAEAQTQGRLIVGLGAESVLETGIALHHTYGMPLIPGSALKGLARHYFESVAGRTASGSVSQAMSECCDVLFGSTGEAGHITFYDAWYVPDSAPDDRPLVLDVITVHHPTYYQRGGAQWPWDFDDPVPIQYLSVRGRFWLAIQGPSEAWAQLGLKVTLQALEDYGIGGKTASGYGRLSRAESTQAGEPGGAAGQEPSPGTGTASPELTDLRTPGVPGVTESSPLVRAMEALPSHRVKPEAHAFYTKWAGLPPDDPARQPLATVIVRRLRDVGALPGWEGKPWVRELLDSLGNG